MNKDIVLQNLESFKTEALAKFNSAQNKQVLYDVKVQFLGKKGGITEILKDLGKLSAEDRPLLGQASNQVKQELEQAYEDALRQLNEKEIESALKSTRIDTTLPGLYGAIGHAHPISSMLDKLTDVFVQLGFDVHEGPEIETDYYNFEALNIPPNHPARDMQDTFYVSEGKLLRTHTSPVQIRVMKDSPPPIYIVAPGTVYRKDSDVTHTPMFHQIEGLVIDKGITIRHLKGVVESFLREIFDAKTKVRFRPSFFPFTEPSAEVDIGCVNCLGKGCRLCKNTGWIEIMGCGMVHPKVLANVGIDKDIYTGFAFGVGIERLTMLYHGVNDLRLFFENDSRFLASF